MDTQGIIDAAIADLKQGKLDKRLGKQQKGEQLVASYAMRKLVGVSGLTESCSLTAGKRKGLTLDEIEAAEGSTVRESKVGMASTRRAKTRKSTAKGPACLCR